MKSVFFKQKIDGPVATLTMNRPEKANGMSPDFWNELPALMRALGENTEIRALVIAGEGKHFTGGMDLSSFNGIADLTKGEPARAAYALRNEILRLQKTLNALEETHFPVIAAIHGACIGAGIDMISACDIRLSSNDAYFAIEEINIGMAADVGTLQRLPKLIAPGIVKELAYTGRRFSPQEALNWGFVNSIHQGADQTLQAATKLAHQIATKSPIAITGTKRALDYARDHSVADSLDQIATWNAGMLRPEELMTAIQAKMAKKEAIFKDLMLG
ncbi:MAG: crotonase/enoyl-CoA hydratase family protein [Salaquimonas sp.]